MVIFFALTMPFKHIYKPPASSVLKPLKKDYYKIINNFDKDLSLFINQLPKEEQQKFNQLTELKAKKLKEYHTNKKQIKSELSYKGYTSYRYFLYAVGIPFCLLILSFRYWYLILSKNEENRFKRIFLNIESFAFSYVALYWLAWVYFTNTDFDLKYYKISYILITALVLCLVYLIIKAIIYSEQKHLRVIKYLNQEIFVEIKNDFINLFNDQKYQEMYFNKCSDILEKQLKI